MHMKKAIITTAIPYVNAAPHIGFAMELIQADALARYYRSKLGDDNVFALRGTDENSLKNVRAAEAAGEETATFVEKLAKEFESLQTDLNLSYNAFIRTREDRHIKGAQKLWAACKPEDIYKKTYKGMYCVGCEIFYTEKECPDGICPDHKKPLENIEEENYFFKLSNYQKQLEDLIASDTYKLIPESKKNEVLSFIRGGLEDFSISRSQERAKHWGVPVPGDGSQVMYVWFDALSNYITALDYHEDADLYQTFWTADDVKRIHVIGKGISRFHAVYWPAMLLSAGVPLPHELFIHGYITVEGEKMSKSIGNVYHPKELVNEYGVDAVRYFFLREIPSHGDGDYSKTRMEERYAELANQLGNLVGRVATMANKYFDGVLDKDTWVASTDDIEKAMDNYDFKLYIDQVFDIVRKANEHIENTQPFKLIKTDEAAAKKALSETADMIRWAANALEIIIPETAKEIQTRYNGEKILTGDPLFPRRD